MIIFVLYITATFIWESTWLGIKLQLDQVPPILSVGCRFCLASFILLVCCILTNKTFFEEYQWSVNAVVGVIVVLVANLIILIPAATLEK
jgi:hypothetical protein